MQRHPGLLLSPPILVTLRKASENSDEDGWDVKEGEPGLGTTSSWNQISVLPTNSSLGQVDSFPDSQCSPPSLVLCSAEIYQKANTALNITAPLS